MLTGRAHPLPVVVLAFSIALGMGGCVAPTPDPTPSTSAAPSASPLFNSDEEALAAATEAYAAYLTAADQSGQGGWLDSSALQPLQTDEAFADDVAIAKKFSALGYLQLGASSFDSLKVQQVDVFEVIAYLCLDVTQVDVVDATGASIVDRSQPRRLPLEVSFTPSDERDSLVFGGSEVWSGETFC